MLFLLLDVVASTQPTTHGSLQESTADELRSGGSIQRRPSIDQCTREFLEQEYTNAVRETRPTTLHADNTVNHVDRIKGLWEK